MSTNFLYEVFSQNKYIAQCFENKVVADLGSGAGAKIPLLFKFNPQKIISVEKHKRRMDQQLDFLSSEHQYLKKHFNKKLEFILEDVFSYIKSNDNFDTAFFSDSFYEFESEYKTEDEKQDWGSNSTYDREREYTEVVLKTLKTKNIVIMQSDKNIFDELRNLVCDNYISILLNLDYKNIDVVEFSYPWKYYVLAAKR